MVPALRTAADAARSPQVRMYGPRIFETISNFLANHPELEPHARESRRLAEEEQRREVAEKARDPAGASQGRGPRGAWDDDYEVGEVPPSQAWSSQGWSQRAAAATKTSPFFHVANQAQAGWIHPPPAAPNHASAPMMAGAPPNSANAFDEIDDSALMGMPMDY